MYVYSLTTTTDRQQHDMHNSDHAWRHFEVISSHDRGLRSSDQQARLQLRKLLSAMLATSQLATKEKIKTLALCLCDKFVTKNVKCVHR